jgi:hypothetical protein
VLIESPGRDPTRRDSVDRDAPRGRVHGRRAGETEQGRPWPCDRRRRSCRPSPDPRIPASTVYRRPPSSPRTAKTIAVLTAVRWTTGTYRSPSKSTLTCDEGRPSSPATRKSPSTGTRPKRSRARSVETARGRSQRSGRTAIPRTFRSTPRCSLIPSSVSELTTLPVARSNCLNVTGVSPSNGSLRA